MYIIKMIKFIKSDIHFCRKYFFYQIYIFVEKIIFPFTRVRDNRDFNTFRIFRELENNKV